jgi:hypothetical protein
LLEQEAIHYFFENENLVLSILFQALHMAESNSKFILTILKKYKIARQPKQQFENRFEIKFFFDFNFLKVVNIYLNKQKKKLNLKFFLVVIIAC